MSLEIEIEEYLTDGRTIFPDENETLFFKLWNGSDEEVNSMLAEKGLSVQLDREEESRTCLRIFRTTSK